MGRLYAGLTISATLKSSGTENEYSARLQGHYAGSILTDQELGKRQEILDDGGHVGCLWQSS